MELKNCPKTKEEWEKPWLIAVYGTDDVETAYKIVDDIRRAVFNPKSDGFIVVSGPNFTNMVVEFIPLLEEEK